MWVLGKVGEGGRCKCKVRSYARSQQAMRSILLLRHTTRWWAEMLFPGGYLGDDLSLWASVEEHPGYRATLDWLERQGLTPSDRPARAKSLLTRSLLPDLIHAASGLERAVELLKYHTAETQDWVDEILRPKGDLNPGSQVHAADVTAASLAFSDVLLWTRNILDRIDRSEPGTKRRLGLLPALAPGELQGRVSSSTRLFREKTQGVRRLANYTAHHSALPFPGAAADIDDNWKVSLRVPDPPEPDVYAPETLTFNGSWTAVEYADRLLEAAVELVDGVLEAFRAQTA